MLMPQLEECIPVWLPMAAGSDADSTFLFIASYFVVEPINQEVANGSLVTLTCIAEAFQVQAISGHALIPCL